METEGEIAVGLRSDGVVDELHREASILRRGPRSAARANAVRSARLPRSIAESQGFRSDGDGANDVPWTRCRSASCCDSSRHPGRSIRIQFQQLFATRFQIKLHLQQ